MLWFYILIFLASAGLFYYAGKWLIESLMRIAAFLGWREFVLSFFVIAFAGTIPNIFVGISSVIHKIPQLSFGDVVGGNVIDLTLAVGLAVLISGGLPVQSRTVQVSSVFTVIIAILPLFLILDGVLSRSDGILLILVFGLYVFWLFSKKERFTRIYKEDEIPIIKEFKNFLQDLGRVILGITLLLLAAEGVVRSASFFADKLNLSVALIGVLIVGVGNSLPEIYFAIASAKKGQNWMVLGDLMGAVIAPSTLVLGFISFLSPIEIFEFSPFMIARFFLIISAIFFLLFIQTDRKITKKEGVFLLGIYITFVIVEILVK